MMLTRPSGPAQNLSTCFNRFNRQTANFRRFTISSFHNDFLPARRSSRLVALIRPAASRRKPVVGLVRYYVNFVPSTLILVARFRPRTGIAVAFVRRTTPPESFTLRISLQATGYLLDRAPRLSQTRDPSRRRNLYAAVR